jgi:hypothetical protein
MYKILGPTYKEHDIGLNQENEVIMTFVLFNPLAPELNPSAKSFLPRFFTGDFNF